MRKPYIFFDFDGTVINTNEIIIDSWNATGMHFLGHEIGRDAILRSFGETIRYTSSVWFPDENVEEVVAYYRAYQDAHCDGKVHIFEGVREVISELKSRGYSVSLVTSRTKATSMAYLESFGMKDDFDVIVTCDDARAHKPDPEPLNNAIRKLEEVLGKEIPREDCLMIGDTRFDIGCGSNAGVETVLIEWAHPIAEMEVKPDYVVARPEQILEIV